MLSCPWSGLCCARTVLTAGTRTVRRWRSRGTFLNISTFKPKTGVCIKPYSHWSINKLINYSTNESTVLLISCIFDENTSVRNVPSVVSKPQNGNRKNKSGILRFKLTIYWLKSSYWKSLALMFQNVSIGTLQTFLFILREVEIFFFFFSPFPSK